MSQFQTAYLSRDRVPTRELLEASARALGFDFRVDEFYKPFDCSGFLPCLVGERRSGFEIYFVDPGELLDAFPDIRSSVGERDVAISFRWGGDMAECACVMIASAALAKDCDAVVHYEDGAVVYSLVELIKEAKEALSYIK